MNISTFLYNDTLLVHETLDDPLGIMSGMRILVKTTEKTLSRELLDPLPPGVSLDKRSRNRRGTRRVGGRGPRKSLEKGLRYTRHPYSYSYKSPSHVSTESD